MQKKLTITVDEEVYVALYEVVGRRHISRFIEDLVRPEIMASRLAAGYAAMAADEAQEAESREWAEGTVGDALLGIEDEEDDAAR